MIAHCFVWHARMAPIASAPDPWSWNCRDIDCRNRYGGWFTSQPDAFAAAVEHMRTVHPLSTRTHPAPLGYCRPHGVRMAVCGCVPTVRVRVAS